MHSVNQRDWLQFRWSFHFPSKCILPERILRLTALTPHGLSCARCRALTAVESLSACSPRKVVLRLSRRRPSPFRSPAWCSLVHSMPGSEVDCESQVPVPQAFPLPWPVLGGSPQPCRVKVTAEGRETALLRSTE